MQPSEPGSSATDPTAPLQRWITYTQDELSSLRFDFQNSVQVTRGLSIYVTRQIQDLQQQVTSLEENFREVNVSVTQLHHDATSIRALRSQLLRDISVSHPQPVPPESFDTLLFD